MEKSTKIKDKIFCVEKEIGILKASAKLYEEDLNKVVSIPTTKSKKKPQIILIINRSDQVGTSSNLRLVDNVQCLSSKKTELLQILKSGALPRNCNVISLLMIESPK